MFCKNTPSPTECKGRKFTRRQDLTEEKRLKIAFIALQGAWGAVTQLATEFVISRTFIYRLMKELKEISGKVFGECRRFATEWTRREAVVAILCLRLEGRCSINSISQILKRFEGSKYSSVGTISEVLQSVGECLPNTLVSEDGGVKLVVMASDEVFSHLRPILISVEPVSSAILRIELADSRKIEVWKRHWECLDASGYVAVYLVNDEGKSMSAAQKQVLVQVVRQSDTFHGVAHRLGQWVDRFEKVAYRAIEHEDERWGRLQSAKSDGVITKKSKEYEKAKREAEKAIDNYDRFHYLYLCLIRSLQVFDRHGELNERGAAERTVHAALDLMSELHNGSLDIEVKTIRQLVPELFSYLDEASRIVGKLRSSEIPEEVLKAFCSAWQYQKNWIKAKRAERRNTYKSKEREELQLLEGELGDEFRGLKERVYLQLDTIIQSSAMVENINSILRMYLNSTKNHVTQAMLNLFMHFHNHRRYVAGKRKGKTPMEILTNTKQDKDWLELLREKAPWEQMPQPIAA